MTGRYDAAGPGTGAGRHDEAAGAGPSAGDVVAGVRLEDLVGEGAAGRVWAGTDVGTGDRVAVKLLRHPGAGREAALLSGLRHPHVLALHRVGSDPPAVVTELACGGSLAAQVRARGSLRPAEVVTVVAPLAGALEVLHGHGVVHGDVTAGNVLFVDRGRPVLADLGGAVLAGAGRAVATHGFVAPEVLAGAAPGPAADVHGLAACAWLALTGHVPPPAPERLPLRLLVPECPDELLAAVTAGLDPDPAARPEPAALAAAARAACRSEPVRLVPSAAVGVRAEEAVTFQVRAAARDALPEARRGRWLLPGRARGRRAARPDTAATSTAATRHGTGISRHSTGTPGGGAGPSRPGTSGPRRVALRPLAATLGMVVAGLAPLLLVLPLPGTAAGRDTPAAASSQAAAPPLTGAPRWAASPDPFVAGEEPAPRTGPPGATSEPTGAASSEVGTGGVSSEDGTGATSVADDPARLTAELLEERVVGLVAARGRALRDGDAAALAEVHHPLGATLADDTALVAVSGPVDVAYQVLEVVPAGDAATAMVTLRTEVDGAPAVTERVRLVLARHDGRWRVHEVSR